MGISRTKSAWVWSGACLCVIAGAVGSGCRSESAKPPDQLNVLLITVDTLRADHLGCYGYEKIKTANIDRLAAEGTRIAQCMASVPITLPSHASIMTGNYPFVHGTRVNGGRPLHEGNVVLAEIFREAGYSTHAEIAAYVMNAEFGLAQGFDSYNDVRTPQSEEFHWTQLQRLADKVCDSTIAWMRKHASERFFVWAHFFDPHKPYDPPKPYADQCEHPYDGEIAFVDAQIGRLIESLDALGLASKTLVVFTADHGEGLWDHGLETHCIFVYDSAMSVPLIFRCPDRVTAGRVVDGQVRTIDIAPTILDFVGLDFVDLDSVGQPLMDDVQGVSLMPLIDGTEDNLWLAAYGESLEPYFGLGYSALRCLRADGWKYIHAPTPELYHVTEDPGEKRNLADQHPERVNAMREALRDLIAEAPAAPSTKQAASRMRPGVVLKLEAIGYLANPDSERRVDSKNQELLMFEPTGPDPKDRVKAIYWMLEPIKEARGTGNMEFAAECCRNALKEDPTLAIARGKLARALVALGRHAEAIEHLRESVRILPVDCRLRRMLARILHKTGKIDEAVGQYYSALKLKPDDDEIRHTLADIHLERNEPDRAIVHYSKILERSPKDHKAHHGLGVALIEKNDLPGAVGHLTKAIGLNAYVPETHKKLGEVYQKQGQTEKAIHHFSELLRLKGGDAELHTTVGNLLFGRKRFKEAAAHYREALKLKSRAVEPANYLAWILATTGDEKLRDGQEAVKMAERAARLTGNDNASVLDTLAAAYAEVGRYPEAISTARRARELAAIAKQEKLAREIEQRLKQYQEGKPFRESGD